MPEKQISKMKAAHKVLHEFNFTPAKLNRGYSNKVLRVDISKNSVEIQNVTDEMKKLWIGGKGFDLWLMLQEIDKETKWDSPNNPICMSSGPLGGTTSFPGSGKTIVTAISPLTGSIIDSNVGGYFGPYLKFAGFDALTIVGKAKKETIIYIDSVNGTISIEEAPKESVDSHLAAEEFTEMYATDEADKKNISVVSAGRAADHVKMGILNFSFWDWRRGVARLKQAGRGGIGTVFRDKKIKALIVKNKEFIRPWKISENKASKEFSSQICCSNKKSDLEMVKDVILKWNGDPDYVIEMMQDVQDRDRYISKEAIESISLKTGVPKGQLYHIATFYKAFSLKPRGETIIQVCMGTACHVKGAPKVLDSFERVLGIKQSETTKDEKFTLEAVACLGCCSIAPVVKLGDEIVGNVQSKDVSRLIENALTQSKRKGANA